MNLGCFYLLSFMEAFVSVWSHSVVLFANAMCFFVQALRFTLSVDGKVLINKTLSGQDCGVDCQN